MSERDFIEETEEVQEEKTSFVVEDDDKAEWCLEKIRENEEQIKKWTDHYEAEKRRACMRYENAIIRLTTKLREYFFNRHDAGLTRETKTMEAYNLPSGRLAMKKQGPEYNRDDDVLVAWLEEKLPQFVKVKKTPDWAALKEELTLSEDGMVYVDEETGEIIKVPGIEVVSKPDEFKVDRKKGV